MENTFVNQIVLAGIVTGESEYKTNNTHFAKFTLRVGRQSSKGMDFIQCVAFGQTADLVHDLGLSEESWLKVKGSLERNKYTTADGTEKTIFRVVVSEAKPM